MYREEGVWKCSECGYMSANKNNTYEHVEAKHVIHAGYQCPDCDKVYKTSGSLRNHKYTYHKQ